MSLNFNKDKVFLDILEGESVYFNVDHLYSEEATEMGIRIRVRDALMHGDRAAYEISMPTLRHMEVKIVSSMNTKGAIAVKRRGEDMVIIRRYHKLYKELKYIDGIRRKKS